MLPPFFTGSLLRPVALIGQRPYCVSNLLREFVLFPVAALQCTFGRHYQILNILFDFKVSFVSVLVYCRSYVNPL